MNEILKILPNFIFLGCIVSILFVLHSQENVIIDLIHDNGIILHNQKVLQMEINSMTNSTQIVDGYNMTSGKCAVGYFAQLGIGGMYHCERQKIE